MRLRVGFMVVVLGFAGCLAGEPAPPAGDSDDLDVEPTTPTPTPTAAPVVPTSGREVPSPPAAGARVSVIDANNAFAVMLMRSLANETPEENLFFSPWSISMALAMAHEGAQGDTRRAVARALALGELDGASPAVEYESALGNMSARGNQTLQIANALWLAGRFAPRVHESFVARVTQSFASDVFTEDFEDPATLDVINAWAANKTHDKITKVLDEIDPAMVAFIMNAVYFKGSWASPFDPDCARERDFTREDGARVPVMMMCGGDQRNFTAATMADATMLRLPYGEGELAMYVLLPNDGLTLAKMVGGWDAAALSDRFANATWASTEAEMPRFKLTTHYELNEALGALGMGVAFSDRADFRGISDAPLAIGPVLHDAVLEVGEEGTVAAAVTTIGIFPTSYTPPPPRVVVDRPFALVIRDDVSGAVLFAGLVHDPRAAAG